MEQVQEYVVARGTKMDTRVEQLMEIIQNMARQQEEIRAMIIRPAEALNNDTLGTQNVIGNPRGARNGNLDSNVGLNIQNNQPANLGSPANNQGIPIV